LKSELIAICKGDLDESTALRFEKSGVVSLDLETSGLDWKVDKVATCQLHNEDVGSVIVMADGIPKKVLSIIENPSVLKIFHHAMFDLRFMRYQWNVVPENVACTKIASKLLYRDSEPSAHSLKPLLMRALGVEIDKSEQRSDWTTESLTDSQVRYAISDVTYLKPLLDFLRQQLELEGRSALLSGCFSHLPTRVDLDLMGYNDVYTY
jgi:ribonuclease D